MIKQTDKIFVAGHTGLVGSALVRALRQAGFVNLLLRTHAELDLTRQAAVEKFFSEHRPDYVFLAAAKVGGIMANNTQRADFIFQNLSIQLNVIESARRYGVKRLLFLGSSCIYPKHCRQPMSESDLLSGYLEKTNEPYAIAKIAGIKMCEASNAQYHTQFISVMPTNLYGQNDNFDLQTSHVLPALIRKIDEAKMNGLPTVVIWGSGKPLREFLHVDDLASACLCVMNHEAECSVVNVGSGEEITIGTLAALICEIMGYDGCLVFDTNKPDGTPRKLLNSEKIHQLGWRATISLREGIAKTVEWFLQHHGKSHVEYSGCA